MKIWREKRSSDISTLGWFTESNNACKSEPFGLGRHKGPHTINIIITKLMRKLHHTILDGIAASIIVDI